MAKALQEVAEALEKETANPTHYIDNKEFYNDFVVMRAANMERKAAGLRPDIGDAIGAKILKICTRLSYRFNFINYHFREEMVGDAIQTCILYIWSFDPEKSKNPFSYFTLVAFRAFVRRIQKERKIYQNNLKYIEHMKIDIFNMGDINAVDNDAIALSREIDKMLGGSENTIQEVSYGDDD